jgi:hypothetical protein
MATLTLTKEELNALSPTSLLWCMADDGDLHCGDFSQYSDLDPQEIEDSRPEVVAHGFEGDYPTDRSGIDNYFIFHFLWSAKSANGDSAKVVTFHEGEFRGVQLIEANT